MLCISKCTRCCDSTKSGVGAVVSLVRGLIVKLLKWLISAAICRDIDLRVRGLHLVSLLGMLHRACEESGKVATEGWTTSGGEHIVIDHLVMAYGVHTLG